MKYYWILYTYNGSGYANYHETTAKEHPFEWREHKPNRPVLLDWKEITKKEYLLFTS